MLSEKDIDNLALLARLELSPADKAGLQKDLSSILDYVSELGTVSADVSPSRGTELVRNVLRDDDKREGLEASPTDILSLAETENGFVKVKQIIGQTEE